MGVKNENRREYLKDVAKKFEQERIQLYQADTNFKGETFSEERINELLDVLNRVNADEFDKRRQPRPKICLPETFSRVSVQSVIKKVLLFYKSIDNKSYLNLLNRIIFWREDAPYIGDAFPEVAIDWGIDTGSGVPPNAINEETYKRFSSFVKRDTCSIKEAMSFIHDVIMMVENEIIPSKDNFNLAGYYLKYTTPTLYEAILGQQIAGDNLQFESEINDIMYDRTSDAFRCMFPMNVILSYIYDKEIVDDVDESYIHLRVDSFIDEQGSKSHGVYEGVSYIISRITLPVLLEEYNKNPAEGMNKIKKYRLCVAEHDFDGALAIFGINLQDEECFKSIVDNYRKLLLKYRYFGRREDVQPNIDVSKRFTKFAEKYEPKELEWFDTQGKKIGENYDRLIQDSPNYKGYIPSYSDFRNLMDKTEDTFSKKKSENLRGKSLYGTINSSVDDEIIALIRRDKAIALVLQFYSDFDKKLYDRIIEWISEGNIGLANPHERKNKELIKKEELPRGSSYWSKLRKVWVMLIDELKSGKNGINLESFGDAFAELWAMSALAHELGHMLGDSNEIQKRLEVDYTGKVDYNYQAGDLAGRILAETTSIMFENLFGEFLLEKDPKVYAPIVKYIRRNRIKHTSFNISRTKIVADVADIYKNRKDTRSLDDYRAAINSSAYIGEYLKENIEKAPQLGSDYSYAMAILLVPTFIKRYREDKKKGKESVLGYLDQIKHNNFEGALACFDIDLKDEKCLNELKNNLYEYMKEQEIDPSDRLSRVEIGCR